MIAAFPPLPLGEGWGEGGLRVAEPSAKYIVRVESALARRLEFLATAVGGAAKLRGLVLSLAVRGQLTNSVGADGSASSLLAGINAERRHSADKGSTKRDATVACLLGANAPFRLPQSWCWVRLGDVSTYGSCVKASLLSDDTWVLDLEDVEKDTGRILQWKTFAERRSQSDKNIFRSGDVLYGKLRPYLNKVVVADRDGVCTTEILPVRPLAGISSRYLKVALQSPYFLAYVNSKSYGMKMPRLGTDDGRSAAIPLPPLAEQHRIVARVEELMKLCDALEQSGRLADEQHARLTSTLFDALAASESAHALAENWQRIAERFDLLLDRPEAIDALEQTILQLAVRGLLVPQDASDEPAGELIVRIRSENDCRGVCGQEKFSPEATEKVQPFELPVGWAWSRFGQLGEFGRGKSKHRPRNDPRLFARGVHPLIQTGEVSRAEQFITQVHSYYSDDGLAQSKLWPKGTLCITIAANIADSAILGFDACFPDSVVGFVPAKTIGDARYFLTFMKTVRQRLIDFAPATAQKNINLDALNNVLIPLPPLAEQHRIVARVEELRRLCAQLRERLTEARRIQSQLADALVQQVTNAPGPNVP
jgi:type I restriction enzyme, S subunit